MPTQAGGEERGEAGKRKNDCDSIVDTERSSISTTSSATSSSNGRHWTSTSANKLSKVGGRGTRVAGRQIVNRGNKIYLGKTYFIEKFPIMKHVWT